MAVDIDRGQHSYRRTATMRAAWRDDAGGSESSCQGGYGGVLTEKTGTLTGTQAWTMPEGQQTRTCTAALVRNAAIAE
jgi:hypothetical protein